MPRSLRPLLPALALALAVLPAATAHATTMVARSVEELARASQSVVRATTLSTRSAWDAQHRHIITTVRLRALEKIAGTVEAGSEFEVRQTGGIVGGIEEMLVGSPRFINGEEVVLFLLPDGKGSLTVAELAQGKLEVQRERSGLERLTRRDLAAIEWANGPGPERVTTLATLRARVAEALRSTR